MTTAQFIAANQFSKSIYYGSVSKAIQLTKTEDAKALGLSKKAFGELAYEMYAKRTKRQQNKPFDSSQLAKQLQDKLRKSVNKRLTDRLVAGFTYRQPDSAWVDQNNTIQVVCSAYSTRVIQGESGGPRTEKVKVVSSFDVLQQTVWHPKHNWRANQTTHRLLLSPLDTFTTVGGLLTLYRKADEGKKVIPCTWYEQSRGFEVKVVKGFLIGGYHIEGEDPAAALATAMRRLEKARIEAKRLKDLKEQRESAVLDAKTVSREYGFCLPGIRQFCEANGLDATRSYTFKELRTVVVANRDLNCRMYQSYLKKMGLILNC